MRHKASESKITIIGDCATMRDSAPVMAQGPPTNRPSRFEVQWDLGSDFLAGGTDEFARVCERASRSGASSVLVRASGAFSHVLRSIADAANSTPGLEFVLASDFPSILRELRGTDLVQAAEQLRGRLAMHVIFPTHTSRQEFVAAEEFLTGCIGRCPNLVLHIEGDLALAAFLAIKVGGCYWRRPRQREQFFADVLPVLHFGRSIGLISHLVARESHEMAREDFAVSLPPEYEGRIRWLTPNLCTNIEDAGNPFAAIVGSYGEVAEVIGAFKSCGVTRFMPHFTPAETQGDLLVNSLLPLIRSLESTREAS